MVKVIIKKETLKKALKESETETSELLGGTEENRVSLTRSH